MMRRRENVFVYCGEMVAELSNTMQKRLDSSGDDIQFAVHYIRSIGERVEITNNLHVVERDPDDDKFIECAVVGNADCIVSRDKHLLDIKRYRAIEIITPDELLKRLRTTKS